MRFAWGDMKWILTGVNALALVVFVAFAGVQANDLDPEVYHKPSVIDAWLWFVFYGFVAFLFLLALARREWLRCGLLVVAVVACGVQMARTAPGVYRNVTGGHFTMGQEGMSAASPEVELSREFFGAVIALAGVGFLGWQRRRWAGVKESTEPGEPGESGA